MNTIIKELSDEVRMNEIQLIIANKINDPQLAYIAQSELSRLYKKLNITAQIDFVNRFDSIV